MSSTLTPTQPMTRVNGLDTRKMVETVSALKANPTLAKFEFRARNRWISGGENRSTIKDFYGAGAEDTSRQQAFEFTNGEIIQVVFDVGGGTYADAETQLAALMARD